MLPDESNLRNIEPCWLCGLEPDECRCMPIGNDLDVDEFDDDTWEEE